MYQRHAHLCHHLHLDRALPSLTVPILVLPSRPSGPQVRCKMLFWAYPPFQQLSQPLIPLHHLKLLRHPQATTLTVHLSSQPSSYTYFCSSLACGLGCGCTILFIELHPLYSTTDSCIKAGSRPTCFTIHSTRHLQSMHGSSTT